MIARRKHATVRQYREALLAIEARLNDGDRRALAAQAAAR
jgi:hypothetical protein